LQPVNIVSGIHDTLSLSRKGKSMKKSVLAAALSAFCVTTYAQTVTIYGLMDTAVQSYDNGATRYVRSADNAFNTSRLGFRGSEDLGSGLKVDFVLEGAVSLSTGSLGSTTTNQVFSREAQIGLISELGTVRLGRTDATMASEVDAYVGAIGPNWHLHPVNGTAIELGADQNNVIKYVSPVINGLQVEIGRAGANGHGATTDSDTDLDSISARWSHGKVRVSLGHARLKGATSAADRDATTLGVGYDFGAFKAGVAHARGDASTTGDATSTSTVASLGFPVGNGVTLAAAYAVAKNGAQTGDNQGKGMLLGAYKALSKRTNIYAFHTNISNGSNSSMAWGQTTAPASAGQDPKAVTVGISHTF